MNYHSDMNDLPLQPGILSKPGVPSDKQFLTNDCPWPELLSGQHGIELQELAHTHLGNYIYVVAINFLKRRSADLPRLNRYQMTDLMMLAEDFAQRFMEKLAKDEYALLKKYSGTGRFMAWAAQVTNNLISSELRKVRWSRDSRIPDELACQSLVTDPEAAAYYSEVKQCLKNCLEQLPDRHQVVLMRCIVNGEKAQDVAEELKLTANAVYLIVHRAKSTMRHLLSSKGITSTDLAL